MSGNKIVADTSFLINYFNGKLPAETLDDKVIWISGITEIELLSHPNVSPADTKLIRSFLADCKLVELDRDIRNIAISIRKEYKLKYRMLLYRQLHYTTIFLYLLLIKTLKK